MISGRNQLDAIFDEIKSIRSLSTDSYSDCIKQFYSKLRATICGHNKDGTLSSTSEYALKYANNVMQICAQNAGQLPNELIHKIAALSC